MKTLILLAFFFFGAFSVNAQSLDANDYKHIFTVDGTPHFVDATSLQVVANQNRVFWSAFQFRGMLTLTSLEANCVSKKLRMRTAIFIKDGAVLGRNTKISNWFPKNDTTATPYIRFACSTTKLPLVEIPDSVY